MDTSCSINTTKSLRELLLFLSFVILCARCLSAGKSSLEESSRKSAALPMFRIVVLMWTIKAPTFLSMKLTRSQLEVKAGTRCPNPLDVEERERLSDWRVQRLPPLPSSSSTHVRKVRKTLLWRAAGIGDICAISNADWDKLDVFFSFIGPGTFYVVAQQKLTYLKERTCCPSWKGIKTNKQKGKVSKLDVFTYVALNALLAALY